MAGHAFLGGSSGSGGGGGGQPATTTTVWYSQAQNAASGVGSSVELVSGTRYWSEIMIPFNVTATGISWLVAGYGNTENVPVKIIVELHDNTGVLVAKSNLSGTLVNYGVSPGQMQAVPFTTPYGITAGRYFVALQFDHSYDPETADIKFQSDTTGVSPYVSGSATGSFGDAVAITPGTTYTTQVAPYCATY